MREIIAADKRAFEARIHICVQTHTFAFSLPAFLSHSLYVLEAPLGEDLIGAHSVFLYPFPGLAHENAPTDIYMIYE